VTQSLWCAPWQRIVWAGDFNLPLESPALLDLEKQGMSMVSSQLCRPTHYAAVVYSRPDHVFSLGCMAVTTDIPQCPNTHCVSEIPL
jgi:hypothetical protein